MFTSSSAFSSSAFSSSSLYSSTSVDDRSIAASKIPRGYIYILEGRIGRIEKDITPVCIIGFCTDHIQHCSVHVIISKDKRRYSYIHANPHFSQTIISQEVVWAGQGSHHFIYSREIDQQPSPPNTTYVKLDDEKEVVSVAIGEAKPSTHGMLPQLVAYHPQSLRLFTTHLVDSLCLGNSSSSSQHPEATPVHPLIFALTDWIKFPLIELSNSSSSKKFIHEHNISAGISALELFYLIVDSSSPIVDEIYFSGVIYALIYIDSRGDKYSPQDFLDIGYKSFITHGKISESNTIQKINELKRAKDFGDFEVMCQLLNNLGILQSRDKLDARLLRQTYIMIEAYNVLFKRFVSTFTFSFRGSMFLQLVREIRNTFIPHEGLQICVPHTDHMFQNYLANELIQELKIDGLYVECPIEVLAQLNKLLQTSVIPLLNSGKITEEEARQALAKTPQDQTRISEQKADLTYQTVIEYSIISKVPVIPIDQRSEDSNRALAIIQGGVSSTKDEQKWAFDTRVADDNNMVSEFKKDFSAHRRNRYIVYTGSMHSGISKKLGIKCFQVFSRDYLSVALKAFPLLWDKLLETNYIFLYSPDRIKPTNFLFNNSGFFSPSRNATVEQPSGPYKDHYCGFKDDILVEEGIKFSQKKFL